MAISRKVMIARIVVYAASIGLLLLGLLAGCGGAAQKKKQDFFTSGSKEADQRASQRMARSEQLKGDGEAAGQKKPQPEVAKTLYDRLGGEAGIKAIVDDFVNRAIADPRVNWERKGIKGGTLLRAKSVTWNASPENVAQLKKHLVQFLSIATGGPTFYDGREIGEAHKGLKITNAEFDASVGDLKAALDKLGIANKEQKELLSIIESTRPQVAEQR